MTAAQGTISSRVNEYRDRLAWDTLTLEHWQTLITEMLRRHDIEAIPSVLALMATHGFAQEADDLRRLMVTAGEHR